MRTIVDPKDRIDRLERQFKYWNGKGGIGNLSGSEVAVCHVGAVLDVFELEKLVDKGELEGKQLKRLQRMRWRYADCWNFLEPLAGILAI